jgi:ABC-type nitrate/sulfonate/bicarbonate transport system substrate-binding protein
MRKHPTHRPGSLAETNRRFGHAPFIAILSLCVAVALTATTEAAAQASRKITLSYSAVSMTWLPVKVAVDKAFFRQQGLEPELIQMRGNIATAALATGDLDFSLNISPVLNGAIQGLGLKLVAGLNTRPLFSLVVRPEIKTAADLKGKVLAVSSFGNTQAILTEKHLQHLGLKKAEYQLLAMGATGARIAALEKNLVQGSLMPPPSNVVLENQGYRLLGNTAEIIAHPIAGLGTHESKIKSQPEMIKRVLRATLRGLQFVRSSRNDTVKIIMALAHIGERDAAQVYDLSKAGFSPNGLLTDDDLGIEWGFIQQETRKTNVPVSVAYDMALLREVQKELGVQ